MGVWDGAATLELLEARGICPGGLVDVDLLDIGDPSPGGIPDMPDRVALWFPTGGAGMSHEGVFDTVTGQLRIRWDQGDQLGAQRAAQLAYQALVHGPAGIWVAGNYLLAVEATGGRPARLAVPGDADRATYVCTFTLTVGELSHEEMIDYG